MHRCAVHQERTVTQHQSDVCACNNQHVLLYTVKFLISTTTNIPICNNRLEISILMNSTHLSNEMKTQIILICTYMIFLLLQNVDRI